MNQKKNRSIYIMTIMIIVLGIIVSVVGLFYTTGGEPFDRVINFIGTNGFYVDTIKMYGDGLYANDTYFQAPIFRGTDLTILFIAIPLLIIALIKDYNTPSLKTRLFLLSVITIFSYHATSIVFGAVYNFLHLAYIIYFSLTLFALFFILNSINKDDLVKNAKEPSFYKGLYIFLGFTGIALIIAWIPDILFAMPTRRPQASIEIYSTSVTNALDIGIIGPITLYTIYLMKKGKGLGYVIAPVMLMLCAFVGIMVISQTVFQVKAEIDLPLPVLITKAASFVVLGIFAFYFLYQFFYHLKDKQLDN